MMPLTLLDSLFDNSPPRRMSVPRQGNRQPAENAGLAKAIGKLSKRLTTIEASGIPTVSRNPTPLTLPITIPKKDDLTSTIVPIETEEQPIGKEDTNIGK